MDNSISRRMTDSAAEPRLELHHVEHLMRACEASPAGRLLLGAMAVVANVIEQRDHLESQLAAQAEEIRDAARWRAVQPMLHVVNSGPFRCYYLTSDELPEYKTLNVLTPDAFADALAARPAE